MTEKWPLGRVWTAETPRFRAPGLGIDFPNEPLASARSGAGASASESAATPWSTLLTQGAPAVVA